MSFGPFQYLNNLDIIDSVKAEFAFCYQNMLQKHRRQVISGDGPAAFCIVKPPPHLKGGLFRMRFLFFLSDSINGLLFPS